MKILDESAFWGNVASGYSRREKLCGIALAVIAIVFSLAIMHGDSTLLDPGKRRLVAIPNYIAILFLFWELLTSSKDFRLYIPLFVAWVFQWSLDCFHVASGVELSFQFSALILAFLFCMMKSRVWFIGFRVYRLFLVFCSFFGIIAFLGFISGTFSPLQTVDYYNKSGGENALYFVYPFSYLFFGMQGGGEAVRLCGLFNEPGYFGTILALALVADGFNMKKLGNWFMLIAGMFTLSFAFFVIIALYWCIKAITKIKMIIAVFLIAVSFIFIVMPLIPEDSQVGWLLSRFEYDGDENKVAGDDRTTDAFDLYWNSSKQQGLLLFGQGGGYFNNKDVGSLSCKKVIVEHGYIFSFIMWGLLLLACFHFRQKNVAWWILVFSFFVSIYQRPAVYMYSYMLILFGGMENIRLISRAIVQKNQLPK